jgi:hypothetical protein
LVAFYLRIKENMSKMETHEESCTSESTGSAPFILFASTVPDEITFMRRVASFLPARDAIRLSEACKSVRQSRHA